MSIRCRAGVWRAHPLRTPFFIGSLSSIGCRLPTARHVPPPQSKRPVILNLPMLEDGMNFLQSTPYGHPSVVLPGPTGDTNLCAWPAPGAIDAAVNTGARGIKRRVTANRKERRRTLSINKAFAELRDRIPNVPADTKLSKIKILRLSASYIAYLMKLVDGDESARSPDFKGEMVTNLENPTGVQLMETSKVLKASGRLPGLLPAAGVHDNNPLLRKAMQLMDTSKIRKSSGRTGWPQYVWDLELKNENPS